MKKIVVHESDGAWPWSWHCSWGCLARGTAALMIRQMTSRKLGAADCNQLAESAALNGLNRIISDLKEMIAAITQDSC